MKTYITALLAVSLLGSTSSAFAQTKTSKTKKEIKTEKKVIVKSSDSGPVTIEIKNGEVTINGEKVANTDANDANTHKKIIISNGGHGDIQVFNDDWQDDMPRKAMLGVYTKTNDDTRGAEVERVMPNTAADKAGLQTGDIITRIDGTNVKNGMALTELIAKHDAGDKVTITYERKGKEMTADASLSKAPQQSMARVFNLRPEFGEMNMNRMAPPFMIDMNDMSFENTPKMGVKVEELEDESGVRVLEVLPSTPADEAGLQKGDIIKSLDGETTFSLDELTSAVRSTKRNQPVKLRYQRNGKNINTNIIFPKATRKKEL